MNVSFYADANEYTAGEKSFETDAAGNVGALIDMLGERFGEKLKKFLLGDNTCFIIVNGKGIMTTGGLATPLAAGDKIEVLPLVGGG